MKQLSVIVTGASTGIGKAIASHFLKNGHQVVINSVNPGNLEKTFHELNNGNNVVAVPGDIGNRSTGSKLVNEAVQKFGRLDVLINNAGIFQPKPFLDVEESDLDRFLTTNLKGTYFTSQAAVRQMITSGGGSIINTGTVLVDHAIAGLPATAPISSKGAIHAFTRQLAAEFAEHNIRVNTVAPGLIKTPLQEKIGVRDSDIFAPLHLLNRLGEPDDIASMCYYLATSSYITGTIINVDGGHVAGHIFKQQA